MENPSKVRWLVGLLGLLATLLSTIPADAQMRFDPRFRTDVFTTDDGLPGQALTSLVQTGDGYLWMVASGMIARFDGVRFKTFPPRAAGLPEGRTLALVAGAGDTLWANFMAPDSTTVARHADGVFVSLFTAEGGWSQLARDGKGTLWMGGVSVVAPVTDGVRQEARSIGHNLAAESFGRELGPRVWRGRFGDLWTRDHETRSVLRISSGGVQRSGPAEAPILLTRPSTGDVLFTESRGGRMEVRDPEGSVVASYADVDQAVPLLVDRGGRLWVVDANGLSLHSASDAPAVRVPLPPGIAVTELVEDRQGNLWGRTVTSGLIRLRELPIHVVAIEEGIRARQVQTISPGRDGSILVADRDGRAYRIDAQGVQVAYEFGEHEGTFGTSGGVSGVGDDRTGRTWFGTGGRTGRDSRHLVGRRPGEPDIVVPVERAIRVVREDPRGDGTIWFGGTTSYRGRLTDSGLVLADTFRFATEDLRSMAFDAQRILWTPLDEGLARIDDDGVTLVSGPNYPGRSARSVLVDREGTIWIGTYGDGVLRYRDGAFASVTQAQGLHEDVASTILEDDLGNLWMAGNRSIHRAAIRDLHAVLDGEVERLIGVGYARDDGIANPETSGYSAAKDGEGRLWFPTFGGAVVIDPEAVIGQAAAAPEVHVEGLRVGAEAEPRPMIEPQGGDGLPTVELDSDERRFDVEFTAIDLRDPEGLRFHYFLDGFDEDWTDAGASRFATYTNVSAGSYTFRVRAVSGAGVLSDDAAFSVTVRPFFYETPVFMALLALSLVAGVVLLLLYRERRALVRQVFLNQLVLERTRDLSKASKRAEDALQVVSAQAERLESLDRVRSRFFANVSHEFRTPLTLMVGPLRDLRRGRLGTLSKEARQELDVVLESGERLTALVEQLLDIARLEVGELRLEEVDADLVPLLERVARSFEALARAQDLEFETSLPVGPVMVSYDEGHLEKVLNNLLGNAFKFTDGHGRIGFRVEVHPDDGDTGIVSIEVEDSGIGIAPEAVTRVFDRFFQADDSSKRRYQGAGVGLSLARELVELHGGEIELHSDVGQGTVVTVRLPLAAGWGTPASTTEPGQRGGAGVVSPVGTWSVDSAELSGEDVTTVLLVEDEPRLRAYLRRHLETEYRVVEASDGAEALAETVRLVPDLVISDVMMPKMDGEELVAAIRRNPDVSFLPVILLTARASHDDVLSGLRGGADDYIKKPFDVEEVLLRARNLIESRRRLHARVRAQGLPVPALPPPTGRSTDATAFLELVHAALVEGAPEEEFGVEALAGALHMSRSALYRKAQDLLGRSPMEVIWEFRLEQAAQWLRETDIRINEIAYGVGFKSVPHFSRKFRERFGVTPSAYRDD